jgi:hypothetical protein
MLALPAPGPDGAVAVRFLGRRLVVHPPDFQGTCGETGAPVHPEERLFVLRYLLQETPFESAGELIDFRRVPGGAFYLPAFRKRTVAAGCG